MERLVASIYVAYTNSGMSEKDAYALSVMAAESYRISMRQMASMNALDVWYIEVDIDTLLKAANSTKVARRL